ncbi:tetratricopeptide repeat protein [Leptospira bouyouniensis]|uniref:Tetratricopeptide repeat protein n=1 Tax=Leptospira bouyouniensis TaxID=2484911 RepID=A0A7I0HWM1_9LEPT|nr:tetratricopeptide repeat protein [Leptospira bouyouniensis]TGL09165.1 tetratricopeptide repeat protein [Leptospira bouyouniensis]
MRNILIFIIPFIFILSCTKSNSENELTKEALEINKHALVIAKSNPTEALQLFKKASLLDPKNLDYINNQGAIHLTLKQYDLAKPLFISTIQINPKYIRGHYNLGKCFYELGDYNSALKSYKKAIQNSPNHENLEARFNLAATYAKLKRKKDAIQEYKIFLSKIDPSNRQAIDETKKRIQELEKK